VVLEGLPPEQLLAFEIAANEEEERKIMDGELEALQSAWTEAEEIAGIADSLLLPKWVVERVRP
jgi:hypothetical protein